MNALGNYRFNFKLAPTDIIGKKKTPQTRCQAFGMLYVIAKIYK